jgi:hypothetical protein
MYNTLPKKKQKTKRKNQDDTHSNVTPKWAKFTYTGREPSIITKLFRHTDLRIAYKTNNNLRKLLTPRHNVQDTDIYNQSSAYQLTCTTCNKKYIGQTSRSFKTRFKEHQQDHKYNRRKSLYAKHLSENNHSFPNTESSIKILHTARKGRLLNTIENFYIHKETVANNQLNDKMTKPNPIFDAIIRHMQPHDVTCNATNHTPNKI